MQDGAPVQTAKWIKDRMKWVGAENISDWPGNRSELNHMENLWSKKKRKLKSRDTSTVEEFIERI